MNGSEVSISDLHEEAMNEAEKAFLARKSGNEDDFLSYSLQAYKLERRAAEYFLTRNDEPTRSILFRSAATLALDCGKIREAEQLIAIGLSGEPPLEIADELRDLFERVNFERHLDLRGIELSAAELQLTMTGEEVAQGMVSSDLALSRVEDAQNMLIRTAERRSGLGYRKGGKPNSKIVDMFKVFLSSPRAASFAITLRLGVSKGLFDSQNEIIDELLDCVHMVNENNLNALQNRMGNDDYFDNFIGLARKLAPDGRRIKMVGFTSNSEAGQRKAMITRSTNEIGVGYSKDDNSDQSNIIEIKGKLGYANRLSQRDVVKVQTSQDRRTWTVHVPDGLIDDVVVPFWDKNVKVRGWLNKDQSIKMVSIDLEEE